MLINLTIFSLAIFICIALYPLKYLKGKYYKCVGLEEHLLEHIHYNSDCYDYGGDWINQDFSWDNIFLSLLNLFIISTCEGWVVLMHQAEDVVNFN